MCGGAVREPTGRPGPGSGAGTGPRSAVAALRAAAEARDALRAPRSRVPAPAKRPTAQTISRPISPDKRPPTGARNGRTAGAGARDAVPQRELAPGPVGPAYLSIIASPSSASRLLIAGRWSTIPLRDRAGWRPPVVDRPSCKGHPRLRGIARGDVMERDEARSGEGLTAEVARS